MATTTVHTFSHDMRLSLRQYISLASDGCKRNFFVLDDNMWFCICNRSNSFFISYVSDWSSNFNHLIDSFFRYLIFKNCFDFLTIFSSNWDVDCTFSFDTDSDDFFLSCWEVRIVFLNDFKRNFFCLNEKLWSVFNSSRSFAFIKTSWVSCGWFKT